VAFVHVEAIRSVVSKRAQHPHAADAENDLLAQPIKFVAAVKKMRQGAIVVGVFRQVCIEEIDGNLVAACATNLKFLCSELNPAEGGGLRLSKLPTIVASLGSAENFSPQRPTLTTLSNSQLKEIAAT
jgi:hypothetical protein